MTRRRRISVALVVAVAVVPAIALLIGLLAGDRERIVQYHEVVRLRTGEPARVQEVIDYDFGAATERHGIYRIIPGLTDPSSVSVFSPSAPDQVLLEGSGRIRIGDPAVTVTDTHRYEIGYDHDGLVDGRDFAWNVVGTEWEVGIEAIEAHVISDRTLTDVTCDQGSFGATGGCDATVIEPGHLVVRTRDLASGEAVTVRATLGGTVEFPADQPDVPGPPAGTGAPLAMPMAYGFLVAAGAGLVTGRVLRRAGREHAPPGHTGTSDTVDATALADEAPPRIAPPRDLTPAQGGVVLTEQVSDAHRAAWLLAEVEEGLVSLDGDDPEKPILRWHGSSDHPRNGPLFSMFAGRSEVQLGEYDSTFAKGWSMVGAELESWRASSGLWSDAGERRRRIVLGLGVLVAVLGLAIAGFFAYRWSLADPSVAQLALLCLPAGIGAGMVLRAWELRVRTPEGTARFLEVESFRRFLADIDAPDVERAAQSGELPDYLAWSVALGESSAWMKAVARSSVEPGTTYFPHYMIYATSLASSTSSAATKPSSSGGGGGGGAGGGGGGGGGGSW